MVLERDEFVVSYNPSEAEVADLLAASKRAGFAARVVPDIVDIKPVGPSTADFEEPAFFREAFAQARREQKPIVLDFTASWCLPCQRMLKETFPDPRVAGLLDQVVFLTIDTDEYPELAKEFGVVGLPDIRLLRYDGQEVKRVLDFQSPEAFSEALQGLLETEKHKEKDTDSRAGGAVREGSSWAKR